MTVREYIKDNWKNSIRNSKDNEYCEKLPYSFTSPCANGSFFYLYYWDTFFINKGLYLDGREKDALNNLLNMAYLIDKYGYMPNSSSIYMNNRTQMPLFIAMCDDYFKNTSDLEVIRKLYPAMEREYSFWMTNRITPVGLNRYYSNATREYHISFADDYRRRVGVVPDDITVEAIGLNAIAECESGWDFSNRFKQRCTEYIPIDLNSIMYFNELTLDRYSRLLGLDRKYYEASRIRKERMDEIFLSSKMLYDYNYIDNTYNEYTSCASLLPFCVGLIDDRNLLNQIISKLEFKNGIAAGEKIATDINYQWGYPNMWPNLVYFAYQALKMVKDQAGMRRIGLKYLKAVDNEFENSGRLWEKYDVNLGSRAIKHEYQETEMLGWTAGIYNYIYNEQTK